MRILPLHPPTKVAAASLDSFAYNETSRVPAKNTMAEFQQTVPKAKQRRLVINSDDDEEEEVEERNTKLTKSTTDNDEGICQQCHLFLPYLISLTTMCRRMAECAKFQNHVKE